MSSATGSKLHNKALCLSGFTILNFCLLFTTSGVSSDPTLFRLTIQDRFSFSIPYWLLSSFFPLVCPWIKGTSRREFLSILFGRSLESLDLRLMRKTQLSSVIRQEQMDGHPEVVQMVEAFFQAKLEARFDGFDGKTQSGGSFLSFVWCENCSIIWCLINSTSLPSTSISSKLLNYCSNSCTKNKSLETQDMSVIYRSLALLIHEGGSDMACSYKALLQLWFAEPKASTEHSRICDHIDLWGILALRCLKTQREELGVRSLCSFLSHPILLPKSWMNWKSHLQPVLARLLWNFHEFLPVSKAGSFGFPPGGPLISPNEPHFVCSFQLGQGWLRYLADWKVVLVVFCGFCLVSKYIKEMSWNIINFKFKSLQIFYQ